MSIKFSIKGQINIAKHTKYLSPNQWFLCENDKYLIDALKIKPKGVILTHETYSKYSHLIHCPYILTNDPWSTWADYSLLSNPNMPEHIIGVTGTNGKTSVAFLTYKLLNLLGVKAGYIGTIGIFPDIGIQIDLTTPDAAEIHMILSRFVEVGVGYVSMEISSSGLERRRVRNVSLDIAVFTSFGHDHLDIHKTIDEYWKTKLMISELLKDKRNFLINPNLEVNIRKEKIPYQLYKPKYQANKFIGFMKENLDAACKVCELLNFAPDLIQKVALDLEMSVPGRLQVISNNPKVIVDYAHTPDALEKLLKTFPDEKKLVIFGCGGDRDKTKREVMGKVAESNADVVIVTDDNPRTEDPEAIRREIMNGCPGALNIGSRYKAIKVGIAMSASEGYTCIIAGKGHEITQIYDNRVEEFSDSKVATVILDQLQTH